MCAYTVSTLVDRHVDRLAHRAARVVQPGRGIGELDEVAEVLERAVAAPAVELRHERRAVSGANTVWLAPIWTLLAGLRACWVNSRGADRRTISRARPRGTCTRHSPLMRAPAARAGCAPQADGLEVAADLEADLIQQLIGVALDRNEPRSS